MDKCLHAPMFHFSWSEFLGYKVIFLYFLRNCQTVSTVAAPFDVPLSLKAPISPRPRQHLLSSVI